MMKKILIFSISTGVLLFSSILGIYQIKTDKNYSNEILNQTAIETASINSEINSIPENKITNTSIENVVPIEETQVTTDNVEENQTSKIEKKVETMPTTNDSNKTTTSQTKSSSKQSNSNIESKSTDKQNKTSTETQSSQKSVTSQVTSKESTTKQEEPYWCVEGGSHHMLGDGTNEHGYYKTWDEAFSAYEQYTKGWESTQYKVDQCDCGLYYFWAIK